VASLIRSSMFHAQQTILYSRNIPWLRYYFTNFYNVQNLRGHKNFVGHESRNRLTIGVAPAMGHWGTCPPRLPASYFGDHSLYRLWRVMRTVFCPVENFKRTNTENVKKQRDFCAILSIFGPFLSFFCAQFSSGSNYSSQNAGTIANKFQLHTYFRFP